MPTKVAAIFFILFFLSGSSGHFGKVIGYSKHKIPAYGGIAVLSDDIALRAAAKAYVLIENVVGPQLEFKVVGLAKCFG
jgi:hypothetical protein